jgi:putative flippase GtrA
MDTDNSTTARQEDQSVPLGDAGPVSGQPTTLLFRKGTTSEVKPASEPVFRMSRLATVKRWLSGWMTKSLMIGAAATAIDVVVGNTVLQLGAVTRAAAMTGFIAGGISSFVGHRYFAFHEQRPLLLRPAIKWALMMLLQTAFHGQLVVWLRDQLGIPFTIAKFIADIPAATVLQLVAVRFFVFANPQATSKVTKESAQE